MRLPKVLILACALPLAACGGGGGGDGGGVVAPLGSVSGVWQINETSASASDPSCVDPLSSYIVFFTQSGSAISAQSGFSLNPADGSEGGLVTGTLSASALSLSGTNPEPPGNTTSNFTGTVAAGCGSITGGVESFSYSEPGFSCTGTIGFNATRVLGSGCGTAPTNTVVAEVEPNDTPATAQPVTMPVAINGSMTQATTFDSWAITLSTTTVVTAMLTAPTNQDIDLAIATDTGTFLAVSDSPTAYEALALSLPAGSYRVVVYPFNVTGTANYTVVIQ